MDGLSVASQIAAIDETLERWWPVVGQSVRGNAVRDRYRPGCLYRTVMTRIFHRMLGGNRYFSAKERAEELLRFERTYDAEFGARVEAMFGREPIGHTKKRGKSDGASALEACERRIRDHDEQTARDVAHCPATDVAVELDVIRSVVSTAVWSTHGRRMPVTARAMFPGSRYAPYLVRGRYEGTIVTIDVEADALAHDVHRRLVARHRSAVASDRILHVNKPRLQAREIIGDGSLRKRPLHRRARRSA